MNNTTTNDDVWQLVHYADFECRTSPGLCASFEARLRKRILRQEVKTVEDVDAEIERARNPRLLKKLKVVED